MTRAIVLVLLLAILESLAAAAPPSRCADAKACEAQCASGSASACRRAGERAEPDWDRAARLYRAACEADDADGCGRLGVLELYGHGVPLAHASAIARLEHACFEGSGFACTRWAREAGASPSTTARHAYELGCARADSDACAGLADLLFELGDFARAARLDDAACQGGTASACAALGRLAAAGEGVPADDGVAHRYFALACQEGDDDGCQSLAAAAATVVEPATSRPSLIAVCGEPSPTVCLEDGARREATRDYAGAAAEYGAACDAGLAHACDALGFLGEHHLASADPRETYARACDGDDVHGCYDSARLLLAAGDALSARPLLEKTCAADDRIGCRELAAMVDDPPRARALLSRGCAASDAAACDELGRRIEKDPDATDLGDLARAYDSGCALGDARACFHLGLLRYNGDLIAPDLAEARALFTRGCALGSALSCAYARRQPR